MQKRTICVVGLGYIGLPTAALLASHGNSVVGVDVSQHAVDTINSGRIHIVEPDLDAFVRSAVADGNLRAYATPRSADVYMICVPTPFHEGPGIPQPNIDYVLAATRSIAPYVKAGDLVILESTSPVGTTRKMAEILREEGVDIEEIHMAYCPERVLPGKIMTELVANDRVVGGLTEAATQAVGAFYRGFVKGEVLETDSATAEMCKLTENSYRDVNIAFANELSLLCANAGIDVWKLIKLANHHPRVNILQPGPGVGGHCIAVDPWFIVARDPENSHIIRSARDVNNKKTEWVIDQIENEIKVFAKRFGKPPVLACLGLAFKPDIDDLRESPALHIAEVLNSRGHNLIAVEPNIKSHDQIKIIDLNDALECSDLVVALVKHRQFQTPQVCEKMKIFPGLNFCGLGA
jgi:UDP-N-acetyl-D-mannosaminuronic acid dehydrogenase